MRCKATKSAPYPQYSHLYVYSITKIVSEFMKVEFTETDPYLEKMRQTYWVMNTKDRFGRGANYQQKFLLENADRRRKPYFRIKLIPFREAVWVKARYLS